MIFMNSHFEKNNQQKINNLVIFEIFVSMKSTRKFTMLLENEKKFLNWRNKQNYNYEFISK